VCSRGGRQAVHGAALYAPHLHYSFTYPPFAALLFGIAADAPVSYLQAAITAGSVCALAVLCGLALGAAGVRRRPETVFAAAALALLTVPVGRTLHLGDVNLILATMVGGDLLRRRDGGWWQGIATGLAAGIKLTPLIFVAYLLVTRRARAAATAAGAFAATIATGFVLLPAPSRVFWLGGVFWNENRVGNPANPGQPVAVRGGGPACRESGRGPALVARRGAGHRPGRARGRRVGPPPRPPACRGGVLRGHRRAGLAVFLDPRLGVGGAAAGDAGRGLVAAPLTLVRPGRRRGRGRLPSAQPGTAADR
jgi:hypothetical protein